MRKVMPYQSLFFCLVALAACINVDAQEVKVTIYKTGSTPYPNASIAIFKDEILRDRKLTDSLGRYYFDGTDTGSYTLVVYSIDRSDTIKFTPILDVDSTYAYHYYMVGDKYISFSSKVLNVCPGCMIQYYWEPDPPGSMIFTRENFYGRLRDGQ